MYIYIYISEKEIRSGPTVKTILSVKGHFLFTERCW